MTVRANSAALPHLEMPVAQLEALLAQGLDLTKEQAVFRASKQEKTQQLQTVLTEGTRLATLLRNALKQHYGPTSEKLAEFGLKPFRGRKARQAPEPDPDPDPAGPQVGTGQ
jgi:tryptophanyl-tRNA synthetase